MANWYGANPLAVNIRTPCPEPQGELSLTTLAHMLNNTYTWGTAPNNLTFVKLFGDAGKAPYSVAGLTASTARTMTVSHQSATGGTTRSMLRFDRIDPVTGTTSGATKRSSAYLVLAPSSEQTDAEKRYMLAHIAAALADTTFVTAFLNGEA